jgi:hypothetical protein
MTKKKKLLWTGITASLVVAVYFVMRPAVPKHNINLASVEKIKPGMTLAEVEEILGVPPGDYTTGPTTSLCDGWLGPGDREWAGDDGVISVWLDPQGRILAANLEPVSPRTRLTWFERLQMWFGLREKTERVNGPGPY